MSDDVARAFTGGCLVLLLLAITGCERAGLRVTHVPDAFVPANTTPDAGAPSFADAVTDLAPVPVSENHEDSGTASPALPDSAVDTDSRTAPDRTTFAESGVLSDGRGVADLPGISDTCTRTAV